MTILKEAMTEVVVSSATTNSVDGVSHRTVVRGEGNTHLLGVDLGMGAIKLFDMAGGVQMPSFVAIANGKSVGKLPGFASQKPPLRIKVGEREFLVGQSAHDWGRPLENFDYERLTNSPEIVALFYAALSERMRTHGDIAQPVECLVGLPLEPLTGDKAKATVAGLHKWLKGEHHWWVDGKAQRVTVQSVKATSQPAGALFDYLLDGEGWFVANHKAEMNREIGVISVGFNTLELMAVRERTPVQRFTAGSTVGVRRLLDLLNPDGHFSLGELDARLRAGALDTGDIIPLWAREVTGVIERKWGQQWRRFARILVVGGGAMLLHHSLLDRFEGKAFVPDQPVLSIARGLYKQLLLQFQRKEG